jgi:hypothetical protein
MDDDRLAQPIFDRRKAEKLAQISAEQGIAEATDEMYSDELEKKKKRAEIIKSYKADVASNMPGNVRQKFDAAMAPFKSALEDLICRDGASTRLGDWLDRQIRPDPLPTCEPPPDPLPLCEPLHKPLYKLLFTRKQVYCRLADRLGTRESRVVISRQATLRWAAAFKAWSEPGKSIEAMIDMKDTDAIYAGILAPRDADYAIYRLLFEVAPRLLSVASEKLPTSPCGCPLKEAGDAITLLSKDLAKFRESQCKLVVGKEREDGTVFLIDGDELDKHRKCILERWVGAIERQAIAEAAFSLRPDDASSLKLKLDKLIGSEAEDAKNALAPPTE